MVFFEAGGGYIRLAPLHFVRKFFRGRIPAQTCYFFFQISLFSYLFPFVRKHRQIKRDSRIIRFQISKIAYMRQLSAYCDMERYFVRTALNFRKLE
jgi:hypothetical protein